MAHERHLALQEITLLPSGEWPLQGNGWLIIRSGDGSGYLLCHGAALELAAGEVLLIAENSHVEIRASSLGPLKLQFFRVHPALLSGLLTLADSQTINHATSSTGQGPLRMDAAHPVARRFAEIAAQPGLAGLPLRCRLLELWSEAIAGMRREENSSGHDDLGSRLREMVEQMPEAELLDHSLSDLAEKLHCSERHFSRLFRNQFGVPYRVRQTESRLLRARQMLAESDSKIIHIAYESGFRHLGLFNSMFKKRFGMTPTQVRQQFRKAQRPRPARLLARAV